MDIADHCAILPNERINPRFGRAAHAIESSESRKIAPLIKRPAAAPNPPHESIIHRSENMRPRIEILAVGIGHPTMPPIVPLSRARLTELSILTIKDQVRKLSTACICGYCGRSNIPVTDWTCIHTLYSFGPRVRQLRGYYSLETVFHLIKIKGGSRS
jgi:hypothetical protein